ncbi:hypothetical protein C8Q77DRAFT_926292 [Trametes polyzona]|nr:hypothetical protein C8Q77DRAFT_926292 [Trametes polyzona]
MGTAGLCSGERSRRRCFRASIQFWPPSACLACSSPSSPLFLLPPPSTSLLLRAPGLSSPVRTAFGRRASVSKVYIRGRCTRSIAQLDVPQRGRFRSNALEQSRYEPLIARSLEGGREPLAGLDSAPCTKDHSRSPQCAAHGSEGDDERHVRSSRSYIQHACDGVQREEDGRTSLRVSRMRGTFYLLRNVSQVHYGRSAHDQRERSNASGGGLPSRMLRCYAVRVHSYVHT